MINEKEQYDIQSPYSTIKVFIGAKSAKMGMKKSFLPPLTKRTRADKIINVRERNLQASLKTQ